MQRLKPRVPALNRRPGLARGVFAAFPFYEGGGTKVRDLSGNRNDGTFSAAAPSWVAGVFGAPALSFNGTSNSIATSIGWNVGSSNGTPITLTAWIKTPGGTTGGLIGNVVATSPRLNVHAPYSDNVLYFDYDNFSGGRISTDFTPYLNNWTFIALTNDGSAAKAIYFNGKLVTSNTTANGAGATDSVSSLTIGRSDAGSAFFHNGLIDDFRLYNRVLSATEIAQLYYDPFAIYRPRPRAEVGVVAAAALVPYNPWPLSMPLLAQ